MRGTLSAFTFTIARAIQSISRFLRGAGGLACVVALTMFPAAANADCLNGVYDTPLPVSSSTPATGATVAPSPTMAVSFTLASPAPPANGLDVLSVRVATQNTLGQNGTLSDLNQVDDFALPESSTNFGVYHGVSNTGPTLWINTPGTYYWQAFGSFSYFDPGAGKVVCTAYASQVYTIRVQPPSGPPTPTEPHALSFNDARSYAPQMIRRRTHRTVTRGSIRCTKIDRVTQRCHLAWSASGYKWQADGRFWNYLSNGKAYWWYDFKATRSWRMCVRRHHKTRCTTHRQHFHWN